MNENINSDDVFKCPCCSKQYYEYIKTTEEAILIGEGAYINHRAKLLDNKVDSNHLEIHNIRNQAVEKFE